MAFSETSNRDERAAMNQMLFRDVNERVKDLNEGFKLVNPVGAWICECANDTCSERVEMSVNEYEKIRSEGTRFFVAPSDEHVWPDVELVTDRTVRYWIVEKVGQAGKLAMAGDPRTDDESGTQRG
jgi:SpoU rRNA methylase family enzyme